MNDLTSISWVIPIREESKFFVDSYSFVANRGGIEAKEKEDKTPYRQYEQAGYCTISSSPDGLIDYRVWNNQTTSKRFRTKNTKANRKTSNTNHC
ncbi:MAG: hypothetical protein E6X39_04185 [Enterococcus hirae]|nr:hypothetical protein [Enterococcus hirae]